MAHEKRSGVLPNVLEERVNNFKGKIVSGYGVTWNGELVCVYLNCSFDEAWQRFEREMAATKEQLTQRNYKIIDVRILP